MGEPGLPQGAAQRQELPRPLEEPTPHVDHLIHGGMPLQEGVARPLHQPGDVRIRMGRTESIGHRQSVDHIPDGTESDNQDPHAACTSRYTARVPATMCAVPNRWRAVAAACRP